MRWETALATERVERKLAAILAADVAGYSRLMGADEEGTLARLKAYRRELIDPKIAGRAHRQDHRRWPAGRVRKPCRGGALRRRDPEGDARPGGLSTRGPTDRNSGPGRLSTQGGRPGTHHRAVDRRDQRGTSLGRPLPRLANGYAMSAGGGIGVSCPIGGGGAATPILCPCPTH